MIPGFYGCISLGPACNRRGSGGPSMGDYGEITEFVKCGGLWARITRRQGRMWGLTIFHLARRKSREYHMHPTAYLLARAMLIEDISGK